MERPFLSLKNYFYLLIGILIFLGLYFISLHNYLLFHSLAEIFSIVVACGIFMITWNSRRVIENNYLLFIGIAYLFIGAIDLVHTLAYKGMGVFKESETNLPTQLWIAARYVESLSLLLAPYFMKRKLRPYFVFLGYVIVTSFLLASIFYWNIFPVCFIETVGLTPFKIVSEYIISLILITAIGLVFKHREEFDSKVLQWITWSILTTIVSELAFTFYIHAYGFSNMVGHFLKIVSFYFIYKALIETGLSQPYRLLFVNLKKNEEALQDALRESKQRQAEISALLEGARAILEYHEFKVSARSIFDSCKHLIRATAGYIALLSKEGKKNELLFLDSGGLPCSVDPELPMPIRGLREETYCYGRTVFENDFPKSNYVTFLPEGHVQLDNVLFAPLTIDGKVIGLLGLANKPGGFNENDARLATAFGELASVALRNSRTLESLETSEERFRSLVQAASDAIISVDSFGKIIFWNPAAEKILGYSAMEMLGKPLLSIIPHPLREAHQNGIERFLKTGMTHITGKTVEMVGLRKSGEQFPIELSLATWNTKEGTFFTAIIRDITERQRMEEQLRNSRDELEIRVQQRTEELAKLNKELIEQSRILESFFKHTITPLVLLDKEFNFIRVNEAYARACQRDVSEFPGHNHFEFYPSEARAIFEQVVKTKTPYQAIARPFVFPDHPEWGETYWDWTLTPILNDSDEVEFLVFSLKDVTERTQAQKAQAWLTAILEATSDFVGVANPDGQVLYLNRSARRTLGINGEENLSNIRILDTHPERVRPFVLSEGIPVAIREGIWSGETAFLTREGREIPVSQVILSHQSSDGKMQYLSTIARDITEQKEEERRMIIRNALLELFAKKTSRRDYLDAVVDLFQQWSRCRCVGVRVLDGHGNIPYEAYVGFSHEFWESENWLSIREHQCACIRVILGEIDPQEADVMTPGGSFCCGNTARFIEHLSEAEKSRYRGICIQNGFLSVAIIPIRYRERIIGAIHLADETENKVSLKTLEFIESLTPLVGEAVIRFNLEEEVKESEGRLRFLSSELLKVQENERKRIAREIHDSIGQTLAAIKFSLESKLSQVGNGVAPQGITLESIISLTQSSIEEARRIQMDLHPSVLDDLGILATLGWFTREYQKIYSHIRIERKTALEEEDVPDSLKIVLYRIIQEALNNIAKHSKANLVHLSLRKVEGRIELMIEDNGMGFNIENYRKGLGLTSMRERTELSEGSFEIRSIPQKGTVIRANWPL